MSSGKGYIHGSRIEYLASRKIETDRATSTLEANQQIITANYGNYIFVDEYAGALDFNSFVTVDIYDSALNAVTDRYTPSFGGKNKIGQAKIKSVLHHEGDPGLSNTSYRIFLTDISMDSGKSFYSDAKSFYANSTVNPYGEFYSDIKLIDSKAVVQESGKTSLVFPFGQKALKTLRSSNGAVNNTEFYYRATSNAVLQTNGFFAVTTTSSYTGGIDRLGYSTGVLGDELEDQFIVTVTSNVSTANITGSINLNSSNTRILGSNLNTHFANGEFIKIYANSSVIDYRTVVSVNSTAMVVDSFPSTTNTTANFGKHFPAGYTIPFDNLTYPGTRQVNVTGNTTFEVDTGAAFSESLESTANVTVQYRMLRQQATQAKKDARKNRYIKLLANATSNNTWNLGLPDVYNLRKVYSNNSTYSEIGQDVTNYFYIDTGQKNDYYDHSSLVLKPQYIGSFSNQYFTVIVDHFSANLNNGIGFFSVDSYPIDDANTANTNAIQTAQIPFYLNSDGNSIDLRDSVDFRAYKANTANSATTLVDATINPPTSNNFINLATKYLVESDTNFQSDVEYYLGRIDLVTLNSTGGLGVIKGAPSENPRTPVNGTDTMVLATASVPPYPTLTAREAEIYGNLNYVIRTRIATNRGYTMSDIGVLDRRIERLEYYTTLNILEQQAENLQVSDSNGLNRFKNGIFVDPMSSHIFGDTKDFEYRFSIDSGLGYGRPIFSSENIDLMFNNTSSTGVQVTGKYITRPYDHELFIYQPFATKIRNNAQDFWSWNGKVELFPSYDMNRDETRLPNIDVNIDLTQPFIDFAGVIGQATNTTIFGTRFGDWRTTSSSTSQWRDIGSNFDARTTTTSQVRTSTNTFIVPMTESFNLGSFVTDVSVQPYMSSRNVAFVARNLKPNTRVYAFFDSTPVSQHCAPASLNTSLGSTFEEINSAAIISGSPENVLIRTDNYGSILRTDENGTLYGMFRIPEGSFRTGDRLFQVLDVDSLEIGADAVLTRASSIFTASNIAISTRNSTITTITPDIRSVSQDSSRVITDTQTRFNPPPVQEWNTSDPIAQSLFIPSPEEQSGVFITKIDLFFKKKDTNLGVEVVFLGMENGVPDYTTVYGSARLESNQVNVSDTADVPTTFVFKNPIFLSSEKMYAFYVYPEANSPEYQMWMSETGFFDIITGSQVFKNPYTGDAFRSSNAKTWVALPKEDIKFNLYVANFEVGSGNAYFENENDDYIIFSSLALANSSLPLSVGDEVYLVNSAANASIYDTSINGRIQSIDTTNNKLRLNNSTGGFSNNKTIGIFRFNQQSNSSQANSTTLISTATIANVYNPALHAIVPRFSVAVPFGTDINYSFKGTSNSAVIEGSYNELSNDNEREMLDFERRIYSYSSEINNAIGKSLTIKADLLSTNKYLSPVIDLSRKSALIIENLINNDNANEHTRYGNALARYISQPITLADGQEAEDIKIYLTAYRPINTEIEVYVKFLNNEDPASLKSKIWTKLVLNSPELRSSPINRFDYKEYVYNMPTSPPVTNAAYKNASNFDIIEYADENGAIYQTYKTFEIKIVLLAVNGIYVPKIDDIRGIALQV